MKIFAVSTAGGSVEGNYPGLGIRLKAFACDYLLIGSYILILFGVTLGFAILMSGSGRPLKWPENVFVRDLLAFFTLVLPVGLYFALLESSSQGRTWGKGRLGLRVVAVDGRRLSLGRALLRSFGKLLPWQIAHTCLFQIDGWPYAPREPSPAVMAGFGLVYLVVGICILSAWLSNRHRTPYDWISGSIVIVAP